jgi:hypothetical protein
MIDPKIHIAISASLNAFSKYGSFNAIPFTDPLIAVFSTDKSFLDKVDDMDTIFDDEPEIGSPA